MPTLVHSVFRLPAHTGQPIVATTPILIMLPTSTYEHPPPLLLLLCCAVFVALTVFFLGWRFISILFMVCVSSTLNPTTCTLVTPTRSQTRASPTTRSTICSTSSRTRALRYQTRALRELALPTFAVLHFQRLGLNLVPMPVLFSVHLLKIVVTSAMVRAPAAGANTAP